MDTLKAAIASLMASLASFFEALIAMFADTTPLPEGPPPADTPSVRVVIDEDKADKALLYEKVGQDDAKKPILNIWHDAEGKVARFKPGTVFTVEPEPVIATGFMKFWQLHYKPEFYIRADACMKL